METLLQKAQRLGIKPEGESLIQKAQRLGIQPENAPKPETDFQRANRRAAINTENAQFQKEAEKANSLSGRILNFGKALGSTIASPEVGLGETIRKTFFNQQDLYGDSIGTLSGQQVATAKKIREMKAQGKDTSKLEAIYQDNQKQIDSLRAGLEEESALPTKGQFAGQVGGTTLDILTAGTYGAAAKGAKSFQLARGLGKTGIAKATGTALSPEIGKVAEIAAKPKGLFSLQGAKNIAKGSVVGYASDVTQGLIGNRGEDRTGANAFIPGLGTALGAGIPAVAEGYQTVQNLRPENIIKRRAQQFEDLLNSGVKTKRIFEASKEKGYDATKVLASNDRYIPEIVDGKIVPDSAIAKIQDDITPQAKIVRAVIETDGSMVKIKDLQEEALRQIERLKPEGDRYNRVKNAINKDFAFYKRTYANQAGEIPLALVDDIKKAKYNNINWNNPDLLSADRAVGRATRKSIENSITDISAQQLNKELGKLYDAQEVLESLGGRAVKGGRLGKYFARGIGAIVGSSGGIGGSIVGSLTADKIADIMQSSYFDAPFMQKVLGEIKQESPDIFKQAEQLLIQRNAAKSAQKLLPSRAQTPNTLFTTPPTTYEPPAKNINTKGIFQRAKEFLNDERGSVSAGAEKPKPIFKGFQDLSTKVLQKLRLKSVTSKQEILDLTNMGDLKQAERDLIRNIVGEYDDKVPVKEFADKVKSELLPLERGTVGGKGALDFDGSPAPHENIVLLDELRGPVANYSEHVYKSPVKTSAGGVHYSTVDFPDYFAHSRIEDLPSDKTRPGFGSGRFTVIGEKGAEPMKAGNTRRVIEIQSDLFQKGRLEGEAAFPTNKAREANLHMEAGNVKTGQRILDEIQARQDEVAKLEPYRNTWHERIIREEVKQAAKDGKTKLQFPTGETAMKIEGLGSSHTWELGTWGGRGRMTADQLKVGEEAYFGGNNYIITDVLGDGKFKAVPKNIVINDEPVYRALKKWGYYDDEVGDFTKSLTKIGDDDPMMEILRKSYLNETFDISGKVDTNNPIYKFYEKEVGKYLKNKYNAKLVTDPQGVQWWEVPVGKEYKRLPIEAFGIAAAGAKKLNEDKEKKKSVFPVRNKGLD